MGGELVEPPISHLKKYIAAKLANLLQKLACRNVKNEKLKVNGGE